MKRFKTKLLVAILAALPVVALAGPQGQGGNQRHHGQSINQRQHNQQARIHQGVRSGELTRHEARRLQGEQRHIRKEERAYRSDGHLSRAERADLNRDLNRSSRHIAAQKRDGQSRSRYEGRGRYEGQGQHQPRGRYEGRGPGDRHNGIDRRQMTQKHQIKQGVRSGQLTREEARGLRQEQRAIRKTEREYRSDGVFTRAERRDLRQDQRAASRHIYEQKHDDDVRNRVAAADPGVNQRQRNEQHRIAQGVRSGELTRDEANGLRGEQRDIRREEHAYKSDGVLTRGERRDLHRDQNEASRNIYAAKRNDERR
jgi:hypothetical protein